MRTPLYVAGHHKPPHRLSYDAACNMSSDGSYPMTWHAENRLVQFASNITHKYDGNGMRVSNTNASGTIVFLRSGNVTLAEYPATMCIAETAIIDPKPS